MIYKQIPLAELVITTEESHGKRRKIIKKEICVCPFCKEKTHSFKTNAMMYGHTSGGNVSSCQVAVNIQYCLKCHIPLIHPNEGRHYEYQNQKYKLYKFSVPGNVTLKEVKKQIFLEPAALSGKSKQKEVDDHPIRGEIKSNCSAAHASKPVVGKKMHGRYEIYNGQACTNTVDVDNSEITNKILRSVPGSVMLFKVDIKGMGEKEFIVTTEAEAVTEDGSVILDSDPFAEELKTAAFAQERNLEGYYQNRIFTMLSVAYRHRVNLPKVQTTPLDIKNKNSSNAPTKQAMVFNGTKIQQKYFDGIPESIVGLQASFRDSENRNYIISCEKHVTTQSEWVLPYTDSLARELLTAAFYPNRGRYGMYEGESFKIKKITYPAHTRPIDMDLLTTKSVHIKSGGGMYSSLSVKSAQIVDLLVYSPYTDRYEILRATLIPGKRFIYTDISLYREFVSNYGKPHIDAHFGYSDNTGNGWNGLQPESLLKEYGYNVSAADGFTDRYRQKLLAEIVDLELLSVSHISHLLNFFITSHPARNYEQARGKWKRDKHFIENYRVNPSRFLILKK